MGLTRIQQVLLAVSIIAIFVAMVIGWLERRDGEHGTREPLYLPPSTSPVPTTIRVQVSGAVCRPGVYAIVRGARVADAVQAAGGLTAEADLQRVNLAAPVDDGQRVDIPVQQLLSPSMPVPPAALPSPINLNTATVEQLESLPGIGPVRAADIVRYRMQSGGFHRVEDLESVPGIGPKILETIRPYVTVR
ncbi:MAG: helix-hairpin-helix domain-containing protein [Candidatus Zipacnadales bacterium]